MTGYQMLIMPAPTIDPTTTAVRVSSGIVGGAVSSAFVIVDSARHRALLVVSTGRVDCPMPCWCSTDHGNDGEERRASPSVGEVYAFCCRLSGVACTDRHGARIASPADLTVERTRKASTMRTTPPMSP